MEILNTNKSLKSFHFYFNSSNFSFTLKYKIWILNSHAFRSSHYSLHWKYLAFQVFSIPKNATFNVGNCWMSNCIRSNDPEMPVLIVLVSASLCWDCWTIFLNIFCFCVSSRLNNINNGNYQNSIRRKYKNE